MAEEIAELRSRTPRILSGLDEVSGETRVLRTTDIGGVPHLLVSDPNAGGGLPDLTGHEGEYLRVQVGEGSSDWEDIAQLQGRDVSADAPTTGHVFRWDGAQWDPAFLSAGDLPSHTHVEADISDLDHDATSIQGRAVTADAPSTGHVFRWTGINWDPSFLSAGDLPSHTHTESEISDLDHDALKIQGRDVDNTVTPIQGHAFLWDTSSSTWKPGFISATDLPAGSGFLLQDGTEEATGDFDWDGNAISNVGVVEIGATEPTNQPVGGMWVDTASGATTVDRNRHDWLSALWFFDLDSSGYINRFQTRGATLSNPNVGGADRWWLTWAVPDDWKSGTSITFKAKFWQHTAGTGDIKWEHSVGWTDEGETIQNGSFASTADAVPGTQYEEASFSFTSTPGASSDRMSLQIGRTTSGDTFAGTIGLIGIQITYEVAPQNVIDPGGYAVKTITSADSPYTVLATDRAIFCDCTSGAITVNLLALATAVTNNVGLPLAVKKIDSSANIVTLDGSGSETIDGSTTQTISAQYAGLQIIPTSTEWGILP